MATQREQRETDLLTVCGSERSSRRQEKSNSVVSELIRNSNKSKSVNLKKKFYLLKFTIHLKQFQVKIEEIITS
jgi:hypothetical protein